ncbi:extracellular solute-binding protein family 1 [Segniliparus rotundus DSM 44985]|uniref:Extracellular solute-binding protein family 1 n=1 Tax=Segniliparus rotundus (strain ATCC BAA-972 / CDC 1076 / CIP 108378 / DSM 44985 / JCM 13578) TaxID=640132 RepID=D6Z8V7_SEGRD|nr:extracellular solute-binding protein family 1 [Segniliparus rotundus DSM 44985]
MVKQSTKGAIAFVAAFALLIVAAMWLGREQADGRTVVTVRLWDKAVAAAYRTSLDEFERRHPQIHVDVRVVAYANYAIKLRTDVAGDGADDLFWVDGTYFGDYAQAGKLRSVDDALGPGAKTAWAPAVVEQFSRDGTLWAVPQLWDPGVVLYYNKTLLAKAGVSAQDLAAARWDPDPARDSFLPLVQKLAERSSWGFGAFEDLQSTILPFIGSAGGQLQDGERFVLENPKTQTALQYVVDLINRWHVAPSAGDTNINPGFTLEQFLHGKLAIFESGPYNLATIHQNADFPWGLTAAPAGPAGRATVANGVSVALNARSPHPEAAREVLAWLGSAEANAALGESGAAVPAVTLATGSWTKHWQDLGVDTEPFFAVPARIPSPRGARFAAAAQAGKPILDEMFSGRLAVPEAARRYDATANEVISS